MTETDVVPHLVITSPRGWVPVNVRELWEYRDMLWRLTLRDIKSRYKQSVLGPTWVIIIPLVNAGIFSVIFGSFAGLPSGDIPYPVFVYTGMLTWQLFNRAFQQTAQCIAANENLITKVYFPRLVAPLSSVAGAILDLLLGLVVLVVMLAVAGIRPGWPVLLAPLYIIVAMACAMAFGIWVATLSVKYRDLRYAAPFLTQFMMWLTPVAYSSQIIFESEHIPAAWRPTVEAIVQMNPLFVAVEGFRWSVLGYSYGAPTWAQGCGLCLLLLVLVVGLYNFRRIDATVADVI